MRSSDQLYIYLRDNVLEAVNAAIAQAAKVSIDEKLTDTQHEFFWSIEIPADVGGDGRAVLANAFSSAALRWLTNVCDCDGHLPLARRKPAVESICWRIKPEFAVQHTQIPAPEGYQGETFKDFVNDTDQPYCWGPWLAKIYMRGHIQAEGGMSENRRNLPTI